MCEEMNDDLQKQVQEKLLKVQQLLDKCVELAEKGSFEFSFDFPGTTYYPTNLYTDQDIVEFIVDQDGDDWAADLTLEERERRIEEAREDYTQDNLPEYAEPGSWWMPSRNC